MLTHQSTDGINQDEKFSMQMKVFVPMWALEAQTASGTSLAECLDEPVSRTLSMLGA